MSRKPQPLYRKVNTTAHGVHHAKGGDYRDERRRSHHSEASRESMHGRKRRGLDYTPLFKFLLSKRGQQWDAVHAEATARLDRQEPIFGLVALPGHERERYVRVGESSYFSGMYVNDAGMLQLVDPSLGPSSLVPSCKCCTHTFNGVPFTQPFRPEEAMSQQLPRRIDAFFYGLFMDEAILRQSGVAPANARRAYVSDFALRIGQRATLVPSEGARTFGMLMALTHAELDALYNAPGLEQYRPEAIVAQTLDGPLVPALCYNLREAPGPSESNAEYAGRLRTVLTALGFPRKYIESVR